MGLLGKGWPLVCDVYLCVSHFPIWCSFLCIVINFNCNHGRKITYGSNVLT